MLCMTGWQSGREAAIAMLAKLGARVATMCSAHDKEPLVRSVRESPPVDVEVSKSKDFSSLGRDEIVRELFRSVVRDDAVAVSELLRLGNLDVKRVRNGGRQSLMQVAIERNKTGVRLYLTELAKRSSTSGLADSSSIPGKTVQKSEIPGTAVQKSEEPKSRGSSFSTSAGSEREELESVACGDLVQLGPRVMQEFKGMTAIVTKFSPGEKHCTVIVLDKDRQRSGVGECWPYLKDITLVSRNFRLGTSVVIKGLQNERSVGYNGKIGTIVPHAREGHPSFVSKKNGDPRPTLVINVEVQGPDEKRKQVLLEPRFLSPYATELSEAVKNLTDFVAASAPSTHA
eukprot:TRINITY_DN2425_c1_g1_i2.p1 TRINITY_DN2425_c1_g1~~TRINITY_DN2425_c1_g1_i2.p1  ORF type:complete len:343 (-),score=53.05 TRINITY_DN2425_c1_g1_i2:129-1157(-)